MCCVTSAKKSNAEDPEVKLRFSPLASPYWLGREIGGSCRSLLDKSPNRLWSSARREPGGRESGGCTRPAATILRRHAADTNGYPRRSFARIPSGISRSVRRSDFGNFERSMHPPRRNRQHIGCRKGVSDALDVAVERISSGFKPALPRQPNLNTGKSPEATERAI